MALAVARFDPYLFTGGDNAQYYALARALATGQGYVDLIAPGAPPHTQYPPGFPALLVPFYVLFGGSYVALKLVPMAAAALLLWAVYLLARRDPAVPGWVAAGAVWTVGLYEAFQLYAHRVLSDMPYVALVVLALAVFQRAASDERGDRLDRDWLVGCALALAAFYVRTAGVTLLAGIVAWALLRRRWKRAALAAGMFAAFSLPWFLWGRLAAAGGGGPGGAYLPKLVSSSPLQSGPRGNRLGSLLHRLQEIGVEYGTFQLPQLFWPGDPPPDVVRIVGCAVGVGLLGLGAWRLLTARGVTPWDLYVAAALGLLVFWPWLGDRYFLTLAPFLWIMILTGLDALSRRTVGRAALAVGATAALVVALLAAGSVKATRQWDSTRAWMRGEEFAGYTPFWADYFQAARWIGQNAPADAVILARKPQLAWYWSGRHAIVPPWAGNPDRAWRRIRGRGVTHILLEPSTEAEWRDILHPRAADLRVVHETPRREVVVLEIASEPEGPPAVAP
jgi:hypothetical protein